jgi:hypothetical protein
MCFFPSPLETDPEIPGASNEANMETFANMLNDLGECGHFDSMSWE